MEFSFFEDLNGFLYFFNATVVIFNAFVTVHEEIGFQCPHSNCQKIISFQKILCFSFSNDKSARTKISLRKFHFQFSMIYNNKDLLLINWFSSQVNIKISDKLQQITNYLNTFKSFLQCF